MRAYVAENLYVSISVNGAESQRFNYTGVWSVQITGLVRNSSNTITVSWYERYQNRNLLLARQAQDFVIETETDQIDMTASYASEGQEFDCDQDGISNLVERRAGTDPCNFDPDIEIDEPEMVMITGGCFDMGSPETELDRDADEGPVSNVCVGDFELGRFEVTFAQYDVFTTATSRTPADDAGWERGNQPVLLVNWIDAVAYVEWLAAETGRSYRLPTEAEWEYAARAGSAAEFATGVNIQPDEANFDSRFVYNGSLQDFLPADQPLEVGRYAANAFGLFDMHGNVWEWTCSEYQISYGGEEQRCASDQNGLRSARGGSWFNPPKFLRSANRSAKTTDFSNYLTGFRVARDL